MYKNAFEIVGTAKTDIKAGDPIHMRIASDGSILCDRIEIRKNVKLHGDDGPTLGELLKHGGKKPKSRD